MKKIMLISITGFCVLSLVVVGTYKWMNARTFQMFGNLTSEVKINEKVIAITFDDGPTENVDEILTTLEKYEAKATFFLIGREIEKHPEEIEKIVKAGHGIGNHSYSHERMIFKSRTYYREEIEKTDELINQAGYDGQIDFRPPNGKKLIGLPYYLDKYKRETIMWNIEPDSISNDPYEKVAYVKEKAKPGSIILLHPMYDESRNVIQLLDEILAALTKEGFTFATVNELQQMASND
ncbi:polysaccharide deacetylase [Bacillus sp. BHET2]|uniref:polysaccharide deacetylase family protein n=1 Tax=Bacillus sp. BHET2 TaxID=2583818 RepID=UPI00110D2BD6|nr:polysaccharide deacetylase family protein [Bacillus sp. BHET2]TMU87515.1 polysaccharide deacetylase [Bacillus sp. BHET2]